MIGGNAGRARPKRRSGYVRGIPPSPGSRLAAISPLCRATLDKLTFRGICPIQVADKAAKKEASAEDALKVCAPQSPQKTRHSGAPR